jgi:predicted nucleotide-binding protein
MAKRKQPAPQHPPDPPKLLVPRGDAEVRLKDRIDKGRQIVSADIRSEEALEQARAAFYTWSDYNVELLRRIFSTAEIAEDYNVSVGAGWVIGQQWYEEIDGFRKDVQFRLRRLESISERLELIPVADTISATDEVRPTATMSERVFVVHGHDEAAREKVARFLERLGLSPVILHEQPNAGRTIIEKFENYADVGFAVVLLTPDDLGAAKASKPDLMPRARQNVIFELGFFVGKLGRNRVCALHAGGIELPSDIHGVVYVDFDSGGAWRLNVAKELREAGFSVDMNRAL